MVEVGSRSKALIRKIHKRGPRGRQLAGITIPASMCKELEMNFDSYVCLRVERGLLVIKPLKLADQGVTS